MENPSIRRNRNEAVWQDDGMNFVFIGKTPDGKHQRVWYFDGGSRAVIATGIPHARVWPVAVVRGGNLA